ncbi:NAD(P)/FAD-dependent oxidoreductase [soil metagenome]
MQQRPRVLIVGGGFAGLYAAQRLRKAAVDITLIDRRNFHLFQPLLYQVATGGLSPANIAAPLRAILKKQLNTRVLLGHVTGVDASNKALLLDQDRLEYDFLLVATGARHHYFGNHHWENSAPGLKTVEDAVDMRRRILLAFEEAERTTDLEHRKALMTFVVIGAGPTGVELAGALGELAEHTLRGNFRSIDPSNVKVLLLEGADRVLPGFVPVLSGKAAKSLARLGVTVQTGAHVTDLSDESVTYKLGPKEERVAARTILWAAGVAASPLAAELARATGAKLDRAGRIFVEPDLSLTGHPEILAMGDMVHYVGPNGQPLPGVAQVAMQQGSYAADTILARLAGKTLAPLRYHDKGSLAVIGRSSAVADLGWFKFGGMLAWMAWLLIHLMYLIAFSNRLLVMTQWASSYFTRNRSARLITGESNVPPSVT